MKAPQIGRKLLSVIGVSLLVLLGSGWAASRWYPRETPDEGIDFRQRFRGGALIISGGGRLPTEIRQRFLQLAGERAARLVIIPAYAPNQKQLIALRDMWLPFGAASVGVLQAGTREEADQESFVKPLNSATGVWLSGGQQEWLSERYAGTQVEAALKRLLQRGGVIGGSSAGAAVMTKVMIEQGIDTATLGTGLDLLPDAVVDQHFLKRSRLNRLLGVLESHPHLIGFGIDEGTALVVQVQKGRLAVLGDSYVFVCLPRSESGERRMETMKRGDHIDLESLRSGKVRISSPETFEAWLNDE